MENLHLPAGSLIANRFEIEEAAGSGGMGVVYRARDRYTGDRVALKLLHPGSAGREESDRFAREGKLLAELSHPAIVSYVAHGQTLDGQRFLAMEWLQGEDLGRYLRSHGPLPLRDCVLLLDRIADALSVAHQRGILHRDLKPSNLYLSAGGVGSVKLLDFGIARRLTSTQATSATRTGMVIGTPEYMAPEQARGVRELTAATDLFSLGCVVYECLTGQPPFVADHIAAVLVRILFEEPTPVEQRRQGVPAELAALLHQLLRKEPAQRPQSAALVRAALAKLGQLQDVDAASSSSSDVVAVPAPRFAETERNLFSVVLAALPDDDPGRAVTARLSDIMPSGRERQSLLTALAELGVSADFLASGTLVVTVPLTGSATDQATRAARAALTIKERWSAAVVSLATGRGVLQGRAAVGEVVEQAARVLRQRSQPLSVAATQAVFADALSSRLLSSRFIQQIEPDGALLVREEKDADESRPLLGKPTPCVGREVELISLEGQLGKCIEDSEARVVLITAPPGMGKSRLRHEFLRRISSRDESITVCRSRGDMMSAGTPYGVLSQALRQLCSITGSEPLADQQALLQARIGRHLSDETKEELVLFLGELAGIPFSADGNPILTAARDDPRVMHERVRRSLIDWLTAETTAAPVVIVIDDLHWGDALSVGLLDEALRELRLAPLLLVALGRPELHEVFPKLWLAHQPQEITLKGLSRKACEKLIQQVLGKQVAPATMTAIIDQSAGNALFLEELIRAVAEGQSSEQTQTVVAMLQARIGRFDMPSRQVVQAASIFGQTFWLAGVLAVLGRAARPQDVEESLSTLIGAEVIEARTTSRLADQREYCFRHALVRDAAYSLLAEVDQVAGHRLASQFLDKAGESDALVVAEHAERGEDERRALLFFSRAAEQALERHDLEGTLSRVERALKRRPAGPALGKLYAIQSCAQLWANQWPTAYSAGQQSLGLLRPGDAWWCHAISHLSMMAANLAEAEPLNLLADRLDSVELTAAAPIPYALAAATLMMQLGGIGDRNRSRRFLLRAQQACDALPTDQLSVRAYVDSCRAWQILCGEAEPWLALQCGLRSTAFHRAARNWQGLGISTLALGVTQAELGDVTAGIATIRDMIMRGERLRAAFLVFAGKLYLLHLLGISAAPDTIAESTRLLAEYSQVQLASARGLAAAAQAEYALAQSRFVDAESAALLAITCFPIQIPFSLWAVAKLVRALHGQQRYGDAVAAAERGLITLRGIDGAGFSEVPLWVAAAEARYAAGDRVGAQAALRTAQEQIATRAATIADPDWQQKYLTRNPACLRARQLQTDWQL